MKKSWFILLIISLFIVPNVYAIDSINDEINANNYNIILDKDINENIVISENKKVTIDLNNYSISSNGVTIVNNGELVINGNGNVFSRDDNIIINYGKLTINGGTYYVSKETKCNYDGTARSGISLIVNGWINNKETNQPDYAELTVHGGTFKNGLYNVLNETNGLLTIDGGTFNNQFCISASDGKSKSISIYNHGKKLDIKDNPVITGYITNDMNGETSREILIDGVNVRQIDSVNANSQNSLRKASFTNIKVENTFDFTGNTDSLIIKDINSGSLNVSGNVSNNGTYVYENISSPVISFSLNRDYSIKDATIEKLTIASGLKASIIDSSINNVICKNSSICTIDNIKADVLNADTSAKLEIENSDLTKIIVGNRTNVLLDNVTSSEIFTYNNGYLVINSGTYKDIFAGRSENYAIQNNGSTIIINNGKINGLISAAKKNSDANKITINNGEFSGNIFDEEKYALGGLIRINGGKFNKDYRDKFTTLINNGLEIIEYSKELDVVVPSDKIFNVTVKHINSNNGEVFLTESFRTATGLDYETYDLFTMNKENIIPMGYYLVETPSNAKGTTQDEDIKVIYNYSNKYTLNFITNYDNDLDKIIKEYGEKITLPSLIRDGYRFDGWYLESNFVNKVNEVTLTKNMTVFAKWLKKSVVTINYITDDGNILASENFNDIVGTTIDIPKKEFPNYYLVSGYQEKTIIDDENKIIEIIYSNKYTLNFITNSDERLDSIRKEYGEKVTLPSLIRDGYRFDGWYLESNFENKVSEITLTKDITVYAKWVKLGEVIVNYVSDDGIYLDSKKYYDEIGKEVNIPKLEFNHYYLVNGYVEKVIIGDDAKTIKIVYSNKYTLTYITTIDKKVRSIVEKYGTKITLEDVSFDGYIFAGWYKDKELTERIYEIVLESDTTVYAKWIKKYQIVVSYVSDDGIKLADDLTWEVKENENYQTSMKEITGYELKSLPSNASGKVTDNIKVIYQYTKLIKEELNDKDTEKNQNEEINIENDSNSLVDEEKKEHKTANENKSKQIINQNSNMDNNVINDNSNSIDSDDIILPDISQDNLSLNVLVSPKNNDKMNVLASSKVNVLLNKVLNDKNNSLVNENMLSSIKQAAIDKKMIIVEVITEKTNDNNDIDLIKKELNNQDAISYYDIRIVLTVDGEIIGNITNLDENMELTLPVSNLPDCDLQYERKFYVLRVHDGVVTKIDATYNETDNTVSFMSDKFSLYGISYQDILKKVEVKNNNYILYIGIGIIIVILLLIILAFKRKKNKEEEEK